MKPILIIGGGISGITSALELAEAGKEVILVEKEAYLGGNVSKMHNYFPKLCPPACGLEINFRRIKNNKNVQIITHAELVSVNGEKGDMTVEILKRQEFVNDFCTSCGECVKVCPVDRPDAFHQNFGLTKAAYIPHVLAFPAKYAIDENVCEGESCAKCVAACEYDAIDLSVKPETMKIEVHSVVTATGWTSYDAVNLEELAYNKAANVITNMEFESLLSRNGRSKGKLLRPSDDQPPKKIAFVQCAGSRDKDHLPYCSAVCCSASLKHAQNALALDKDVQVSIFYIDLRVMGRNEDFLNKTEELKRITLRKGKVAAVEASKDGSLFVEAEDVEAGRKTKEEFDMVVLATGLVPGSDISGLSKNEDGFYHREQREGLYVTGCAHQPMDVSMSVKEATAASIKAFKN